MAESQKKALIYARELPLYPPDEILGLYHAEKWENFDELLARGEGEESELLVACPEILGDDYLELLVNLSKVAKAGLKLRILNPSHTIRIQSILEI